MIYISLYLLSSIPIAITQWAGMTRSVAYYVILIIFFLFVSFRYEVGCDWSGYLNIFQISSFKFFDEIVSSPDPAFMALNALLNNINIDYKYLNVLAAISYFAGFHALARRQPDPLGFLVLSFPIQIVNLAMSAIRQGIAIGFICFAFTAFIDKKPIRFCIFVILASTFHTSAVVFLLLLPFVYGDLRPRHITLAVALAAPGLWLLLSGDTFDVYSSRYIGTSIEAFGAPFRLAILAMASGIFLVLLRQKWRAAFPNDYKLVLIGSCLAIVAVAVLPLSSVISDRFAYYLAPIYLIIAARLPVFFHRTSLIPIAPYVILLVFLIGWVGLSSIYQICYSNYQLWPHL